MPTVRPSGAGDEAVGTGEVRDGGTVLKGGSNAAGVMTKSLSLADVADDFGQSFGSKVIAKVGTGSQYTDRVGISGAVPGAIVDGQTELGYQADGTEWVMQGGNVTETLGGSAYTGLIGGAAGPDPTRDSTSELESTRLLGVVDVDVLAQPASGYNSFVTKSAGPGGAGGTLQNHIRPSGAGDEASSDSAANATLSVPGALTYMYGAKIPLQDDYKAKNVFES
jgi:hypothetical protein